MQFESLPIDDSRASAHLPWLAIAALPAVIAVVFFCGSMSQRDEAWRLPRGVLAIPPAPREPPPIDVQFLADGALRVGETVVANDDVRTELSHRFADARKEGWAPALAKVIIRADGNVATGPVQQFMAIAQDVGYRRFVFREKKVGTP